MTLRKNTALALVAGTVSITSAAFGMAGSAQAAPRQAQAAPNYGCTATLYRPAFSHLTSASKKVLRYTFKVTCAGQRSVRIQHQVREKDLLGSTLIKETYFNRAFPVAGSRTINVYSVLPNTEPGPEEMYHRLRLKVTTSTGPKPWSPWYSSAVVSG